MTTLAKETAMSVATFKAPTHERSRPKTAVERFKSDPAYQAFVLLRIGFTALPIVMGIDKFSNTLVNWEHYLAPWIHDLSPLSALGTMHVVGVVEIVAGLVVALRPRIGAWVVAAWLAGIIVDLLLVGGYYDVALRDFGLCIAALALARLSVTYDRPEARRAA
jgi:uncharacterized membrane protein YphA (DoxX/SURF4 family)